MSWPRFFLIWAVVGLVSSIIRADAIWFAINVIVANYWLLKVRGAQS